MPITNFLNLADIYREADRGRAAQREEDKYQRGMQQEQTLADIFSQQKGIDSSALDQGMPYRAAQPEVNTGTGGDGSYSTPPTGEYEPAVQEQAARAPNHAYNALQKLEHSANAKREMAQKLSSKGFGAQAERISKEADSIDEKIINAKILIGDQKRGGQFTNYKDQILEGASGNSDPQNRSQTLYEQTGVKPTREQVQASYRKQLPDIYAAQIVPEGGLYVPRGKPAGDGGIPNKKTLSKVDLEELREASGIFDRTKNLAQTFRPEFAGKGFEIFADTSNFLESRENDASPQANWARKYEALNMVERHKLFGAALTEFEIKSWNKAKASLAQGSGNMIQHLENLQTLADKVLARIAKPRMIDNYNQEQVRASIGDEAYDRLSGVSQKPNDDRSKAISDYRAAIKKAPQRAAEFRKRMLDAGFKGSEL